MPNNTKKEECPKCHGTGSYQYDENHGKICEVCCKHDKGFLELQGHYGADNGKMCCKAGCGYTRTKTQSDLETELSVDKNKEEHIHKYEYINIGGKSIIGCLGCSSLKPQNKKEPCGTYQMTARCMCGKGCGESSPQSPLSEERWCAKALDNLKEARLQGQRELAEEVLKDIQFDLDKGRFYSICSNETALKDYIRGLLPKITE